MVIIQLRNAKITTSPYQDDQIELNGISDLVINHEDIKELLSDNLSININIVRSFCSHFASRYPTLNKPEEHARIEMAFYIAVQLVETDTLDHLLRKDKS